MWSLGETVLGIRLFLVLLNSLTALTILASKKFREKCHLFRMIFPHYSQIVNTVLYEI
jgi:hypothetical protein